MNKIVVDNNKIKTDKDILIVIDNDLEFLLYKDSNIIIYCKDSNKKININFIYLESSKITVNFYDFGFNNEFIINANISNNNSIFDYHFSTICKGISKYTVNIVHESNNTTSNIINRGITLNNTSLVFDCISKVNKRIKGCIINQDSKIIEEGVSKSIINPILLIDEVDVEAKHSAVIGYKNKEALFYLESKGIKKIDAIHLLNKGFLIGHLQIKDKNEIINEINQYWR